MLRWARYHSLQTLAAAGLVAAAVAAFMTLRETANFDVVAPGVLYRSGQPAGDDWRALSRRGVAAVVNLRPEPEDPADFAQERAACAERGVESISVPVAAPYPDDAAIVRFLSIAGRRRPVLVHCEHGEKRAGLMAAAYRIVIQNWPVWKARAEMARHVYNPSRSITPEVDAALERLSRRRLDYLMAAGSGSR
jgi:protein tyrosine phosphatase (PTP) superfamily phosphohydrolase (DUF442 family)